MALRKITLAITLLTTLLYACVDSNQRPSSKLGAHIDQNKDQLMQQMTRDLLIQDSILHLINMELENIDALFISYQDNMERNAASSGQAQVVIRRIKKLNKTITTMQNDLDNKAAKNKGLVEMIARVQRELMVKEKIIIDLQNTVNSQDKELILQERMISGLKNLNTRQQQDLQRLENEITSIKANAYLNLADLLIQIAEEMPEIRGLFTQKSKIKHKQMQTELIKDAYSYYDEAVLIGDTLAGTKKEELKNKYAFLR